MVTDQLLPHTLYFVTYSQVSSESGWSPNPELLARRQYVRTKWGWFPKEDAFGGGESSPLIVSIH